MNLSGNSRLSKKTHEYCVRMFSHYYSVIIGSGFEGKSQRVNFALVVVRMGVSSAQRHVNTVTEHAR